MRRRGCTREADALKVKLDFLRSVQPKGLWSVDKRLEDSEGVRWVREALEHYDWSACREIGIRRVRDSRSKGGRGRGTLRKERGRPKGLPNLYAQNREGDYRITVRVSHPFEEYPLYRRGGAAAHNEDEVLVWLTARLAADYLVRTGQLSKNLAKEGSEAFADRMLEEFRS